MHQKTPNSNDAHYLEAQEQKQGLEYLWVASTNTSLYSSQRYNKCILHRTSSFGLHFVITIGVKYSWKIKAHVTLAWRREGHSRQLVVLVIPQQRETLNLILWKSLKKPLWGPVIHLDSPLFSSLDCWLSPLLSPQLFWIYEYPLPMINIKQLQLW